MKICFLKGRGKRDRNSGHVIFLLSAGRSSLTSTGNSFPTDDIHQNTSSLNRCVFFCTFQRLKANVGGVHSWPRWQERQRERGTVGHKVKGQKVSGAIGLWLRGS